MVPELAWYPVAPDLTPNGAFVSLAGFPNAEKLKPVPLREDMKPFNKWRDEADNTSMRVAASLGVAGFGSLETDVDHQQYIFNYVAFEEHSLAGTEAEPVGGLVWGTKWGAGLRVKLRILTTTSHASLGLPQIATQIELGSLQASFEAETFGIPDPRLAAGLPGPGRLGKAALKDLLKVADRIKKDADNNNTGDWSALPFRVQLPRSAFEDRVYEALSTSFAAHQIKRGVSYANAVEAARKRRHGSWLAVHQLYQRLGIKLDDSPVPDGKRSFADPYL
ncbi:MAG TPA: hypothetical protein PLC99_13495 [Verrucomicrobiota bacterium]|nr:hypothetical protein [Verrucomicrobiota bacterium]